MSRYSDLIIQQGADQYWPLDESAPPYRNKVTTLHLDYAEGLYGSELAVVDNAVTFNADGCIRTSANVTGAISFDNTRGFSYSFIVKVKDYGINRGIFSRRQSTALNRVAACFIFGTATGTGLSFDIGTQQLRWVTSYYPPVQQFVHIAYAYNPTLNQGKYWVNGVPMGTTNYSSTPSSSSGPSFFMLGAMQSGATGDFSNNLAGSIDEFALFTRKTLTDSEVLAQYATAFPIMRIKNQDNTWTDADKRVL